MSQLALSSVRMRPFCPAKNVLCPSRMIVPKRDASGNSPTTFPVTGSR
mgnify:CR=1 FL=1